MIYKDNDAYYVLTTNGFKEDDQLIFTDRNSLMLDGLLIENLPVICGIMNIYIFNFHKLKNININNLKDISHLEINSCKNLELIHGDSINYININNCIKIEKLEVKKINHLAYIGCPKLQEFGDIEIEEFEIAFTAPKSYPKNVEKLVVSQFRDEDVINILKNFKTLDSLSLIACSNKHVPNLNLESLYIYACIDLETIDCPDLFELSIINCPKVNNINHLKYLYSLMTSGTKNNVFEYPNSLKRLYLKEQIIEKFPYIEGLELLFIHNCTLIEKIPEFPNLNHLHLSRTRSRIAKSGLPYLPNLNFLFLNRVPMLERIEYDNLEYLHVENCRDLKSIKAIGKKTTFLDFHSLELIKGI